MALLTWTWSATLSHLRLLVFGAVDTVLSSVIDSDCSCFVLWGAKCAPGNRAAGALGVVVELGATSIVFSKIAVCVGFTGTAAFFNLS